MDLSGLDRCRDALASSNYTVRPTRHNDNAGCFAHDPYADRCMESAQLNASVSTLSHSLSDYPRLLRVLRTRRGYELLSEDEIHLAQLEVRREVEPQIRELISRAESGLEALQRKERGLHEKVRPARLPTILAATTAPAHAVLFHSGAPR